jgi:hypothetical protein
VLGGYLFSVQNWVRYESVLSLRTGWVSSGGIPTHKDINFVGTNSFGTEKLRPERLYG